MPTLKLGVLRCIETEDNIGSDNPYLLAEGNEIWRGRLNDGQTANISKDVAFQVRVELELREDDDADPDDHLGRVVIFANEAGQGEKTAFFHEDDANYELRYHVV